MSKDITHSEGKEQPDLSSTERFQLQSLDNNRNKKNCMNVSWMRKKTTVYERVSLLTKCDINVVYNCFCMS